MFRTPTTSLWYLRAASVFFGSLELTGGQERYAHFDPQIPYISVPESDFNRYAQSIQIQIPGVTCLGDHCKINKPCSEVTLPGSKIKFNLKDDSHTSEFSLDDADLLVPGSMAGTTDDECFIGVYKNGVDKIQNNWYLGLLFMDKYYIVYDLTPYDNSKANYLQIGIGKKNPEQLMGKQQYDPNYNFYWPLKEEMDVSTNMLFGQDSYDTKQYLLRSEMRAQGKYPNGDEFAENHMQPYKANLPKENDTLTIILLVIASAISVVGVVIIICLRNRKEKPSDEIEDA